MSSTLSPNMSLIVPTVGSEAGPTYALDINSSLAIIDGHNHSSGSGVQITPSGLNINSALTFQSNPATTLSYASFAISGSAPSASQSLYVQNGTESPIALPDLWYFDGTTHIQITSGGTVNASIASLPGESYASGVFSWKQGIGSTTPANFDIGSIIIRPTSPGTTLSTTIAPSPLLATSFTLTLPTALPSGSTQFVTLDSSGNLGTSSSIQPSQIAAASITGSQLVNQTITATQIANNTIDLAQLAADLQQALTPTGAILSYGGTSAPSGFLLCDGTSYLQAAYVNLFAVIGTAFGTADGTHFNVPDLRGQFLRGRDGTAGRDPDKASRTAMNTGGNTGNNVGSVQSSQFASHTHTMPVADNNAAPPPYALPPLNTSTFGITQATSATGGNETRPINAYVNYIIKT
jgi:microcystin-dependent protein